MTYTPNNQSLYTAAYASAIAGFATALRYTTDQIASDYNYLAQVAGAYAQSLDTNWGTSVPNSLDIANASQLSFGTLASRSAPNKANIVGSSVALGSQSSAFGNRSQSPSVTKPTDYTISTSWDLVTKAIVAIMQSCETFFAGQGITPSINPSPNVRYIAGVGGGTTINANIGDFLICDSSGGPITIFLPALTGNQQVQFLQDASTAFTNSISFIPSSGNIAQPPPNNGAGMAGALVVGPGDANRGTGYTFIADKNGNILLF